MRFCHGSGASPISGRAGLALDSSLHQREFLLRFDRDRQTWTTRLFEARNRFGLFNSEGGERANDAQLFSPTDGQRRAIVAHD